MSAHPPRTTSSYNYDSAHASLQGKGAAICGYDWFANYVTGINLEIWPGTAEVFRQFTGKERDSESGLDYFGARYFGSALGRFTSPDPLLNSGRLGNPQSWNRYAYAFNNPLSSVDPTGLFTWDQSFGGGCTDKQLSGGKCDGFDKKQGKGIVKDRKAFREQLNQLNNSGDASLSATGAAIGAEGKDNGVHVFLGGVGAGAAAQVDSSRPLSLDANGNPILDLHIRDGASGDSLFIGLAHEGSHIWG